MNDINWYHICFITSCIYIYIILYIFSFCTFPVGIQADFEFGSSSELFSNGPTTAPVWSCSPKPWCLVSCVGSLSSLLAQARTGIDFNPAVDQALPGILRILRILFFRLAPNAMNHENWCCDELTNFFPQTFCKDDVTMTPRLPPRRCQPWLCWRRMLRPSTATTASGQGNLVLSMDVAVGGWTPSSFRGKAHAKPLSGSFGVATPSFGIGMLCWYLSWCWKYCMRSQSWSLSDVVGSFLLFLHARSEVLPFTMYSNYSFGYMHFIPQVSLSHKRGLGIPFL